MVKKKVQSVGLKVSEKRKMIEPENKELRIIRQCKLLGLNRSSYYYDEKSREEDSYADIKARIIDIYNENPFYGSRRIHVKLKGDGIQIGRDKVTKLMKELHIKAICPGPNTSKARKEHKKYPYLLRNVPITHNDQVWSTDITYIRMRHGFVYLMAIIDWNSRFILGWKLSNSLESSFCVALLKETLEKWERCEIFNTDQGSQFTSDDFVSVLQDAEIEISMDGKGRALDNVYIERFWRTVKYEEIFLKSYENIKDLEKNLAVFFRKYNYSRPHQSLNYKTPWSIYSQRKEEKVDNAAA